MEIPYFHESQTYQFVKRLTKIIEKDRKVMVNHRERIKYLEERLRKIELFLDGMSRLDKGQFRAIALKDLDLNVGEIEKSI